MATDQEIRDRGIKFLPRQEFLQSPYKFNEPVVEEEEVTESFGIPNTNAFTNSGGNNNFNIRTDYRPNYDYRQYAEYGMNPNTADIKQMDMNQEFFYGPTPSQTQKFLSKAINYIPYVGPVKKGIQFLGNKLKGVMPVNERSILENELRGEGIYTDDIGRIVTGQGVAYNTPEGIMSGYNASQMTDKTFDKRTDDMRETLTGKYGLTDQQVDGLISGELDEDDFTGSQYQLPDGKITNLFSNIRNLELSKQMFNKIKSKSDKISEFEDPVTANIAAAETAAKGNYTPGGSHLSRGTSGGGLGLTEKQAQSVSQANKDAGYSSFSGLAKGGRVGYFFGGRARLQGGGMSMGNESNQTQSANMGGGATGDFSTSEQTMNHNRAMINNQKPPESPVTNIINAGSELNYLNNLKNFNLPGIALGFGVNKFRDFIGNKKTKEEEDKLSALPSNNYFADLNAAQIKQLEGPQKMGKEYGNFSDQDILDNITPFGDDETAPATLKDVQTFYGSNGGLASIL